MLATCTGSCTSKAPCKLLELRENVRMLDCTHGAKLE
jgi:hypothetical protein